MGEPLISIIIPTFNSEKHIKACIDSVLIQEFKGYEILVIDNCSSDKTMEIVKHYKDPKIRFYSEPDKGIYDAINKAILLSISKWVYILGSDDRLYSSDVLKNISKVLSQDSLDMIYGNVLLDKQNQIYRGKFNKIDILEHNICHQAIFVKRVKLIEKGLFNTDYKICADNHMNIVMFGDKKIKKKYINRIIANYANTGLSSKNVDVDFINDRPSIVKENYGWLFYLYFYHIRPRLKRIFKK